MMPSNLKPTIVSHLQAHAAKSPDRIAIISRSQKISYKRLFEEACRFAHALKSRGIVPGDRVIIAATSSPEFVITYLAIHLCGAIAVLLDPTSPKLRAEYICRLSEPQLAITSRPLNLTSVSELPIREVGESTEPQTIEAFSVKPSSPADIIFTTGTTGDPKGVVLSHENLYHAAHNINTFIGNQDQDVEVMPMPLCHSFGLARVRCNVLAGGCINLISGFTFPQLIFDALDEEKASGLAVVPAGINMLLKHDAEKLNAFQNQLRYIEIGSAPMPMDHKLSLMKLLPSTRICMHYGLTEASRSTFIEFHSDKDFLDSIGRPTPNVHISIKDQDGFELPLGESGNIWVKGKMTMQCYFKNKIMTDQVLIDNWLNTGDWGYRDSSGYIYLEGREKELVNVGGRKVAPLEIETLLNSYTGIKESACVAVPDPKGITGETVKAYLVADDQTVDRPSKKDLVAFLRQQLEPYKIPVDYEWIPQIPKTSSGKIQRLEL